MRDLEDCLIDAIYNGVLKAKLDQKNRTLVVHETIGRDLRPGQMQELVNTIVSWNQSTKAVIEALGERIQSVETLVTNEAAHNKDLQDKIDENKNKLKSTADSDGAGGLDANAMLDDYDGDAGMGGYGRHGGNKGRKMKHGSEGGRYARRS